MHIQIANYSLSSSPMVQAFCDITIDHWLRLNGLNYLRDGSLMSAQLSTAHRGQRQWWSAVVIIDDDLRELLLADIKAAIDVYVAGLPPELRSRPPRPPRPPDVVAAVSPTSKERTRPVVAKNALPPPARLSAGARKGART